MANQQQDPCPEQTQVSAAKSNTNVINNHYFGPVNHIAHAFNPVVGPNYGAIHQSTFLNSPSIFGDGMGTPQKVSLPALFSLLDPILDASHTRNRKTSPPNSDCFPGTRRGVNNDIMTWANSDMSGEPQHILWVFGYAGCGKSAIAQTIASQLAEEHRLGASFFFFRGSGARSTLARFAATIASQIAINVPGTARLIEEVLDIHPGILTSATSLSFRFKSLVYHPIQAVLATSRPPSPVIVVIDGLDECDDKEEVAEFVKELITFFQRNPSVPLRFLITSRVEDHIHRRLHISTQVRLLNLAKRTSDRDIASALDASIDDAKGSRILAFNEDWPSAAEKQALIKHIGGSFIFMTTITKFLFDPLNDDGLTPMERLPLALKMNPGFDGLYRAILERSQHFPYFLDVISTIALTRMPLTVCQIAKILSIGPTNVVNILVSLHAIFQVPGDDHTPVTLWHTSLRDFLRSEDRSGPLFASPWHHRPLAYWNISLSSASAHSLDTPVLEACYHWREFVAPISGHSDLLKNEVDNIIAHLGETFPTVFGTMFSVYLQVDHRNFRNTTLERRSSLVSLLGSECPSPVLDKHHPWLLIEDIFDTVTSNLGDEALLDHLQGSFPHLLQPSHHLDIVMQGLQLLVAVRDSDGVIVLTNNFWRDNIRYFFPCWPRHLALAIRGYPQHSAFNPLRPAGIQLERRQERIVLETISGYVWVLRDLDELATANMDLVERTVERIYGERVGAACSAQIPE
ncbi:hypothetical protein NMY22_g11023 [Coprinellus aureogranulatus]|nr:hypothetical protein NMY22_g11023 [Coprinellus aureogranulatus]